jgi:hypothetical protein
LGREHEALYLIANYLSCNMMCQIIFDPRTPTMDESVFWPGDISEEDPHNNMSPPLRNPVNMACFVDVDHAGNKSPHDHILE